jgi:hypothetical protein
MSRPRLVLVAWCRRCKTAHVLEWSASWRADTVVGPAKGCRGFRAVLDDEAKAELPELLRKLANCRANFEACRKTASRPRPDPSRRMLRKPLTAKGDILDDS